MKNLLILLVLAITLTAIAARPMKDMKNIKVVRIMKDLEDGAELGPDDNGQEGGEEEEIPEDLVGVLILAEPNGYDLNVNVMILNRDQPWTDGGEGEETTYDPTWWYEYTETPTEENGNEETEGENGGNE